MKRALVVGRDRRRLVLEAVARPDLVDPDALAQRGSPAAARSTARVSRAADPSPARSRAISTSIRPSHGRSRRRAPRLPCGRRGCAGARVSRCERRGSCRRAVCGSRGLRRGRPSRSLRPIGFLRASPSDLRRSVARNAAASGLDRRARTWPRATWSAERDPELRRRRPAIGAATTCSIFIASSVTIGSPASTASPAATWTRDDRARASARRPRPARRRGRGAAAARAARSTSGGGASRNATLRPATSRWTASPARTAATGGVVAVAGSGVDRSCLAPRPSSRTTRGVQPPARPAAGRRSRPSSARPPPPTPRRGSPRASAQSSGGQIRSSVSIRAWPSRTDRLADEPAQEAQVRRRARGRPSRRARRASRSSAVAPVRAVGDDLGEHRVEPAADLVALGDPGVDPDARRRPASASASTRPVAGRKPCLGVLGVEPRPRSRGRSTPTSRLREARAARRPRSGAGRRRGRGR